MDSGIEAQYVSQSVVPSGMTHFGLAVDCDALTPPQTGQRSVVGDGGVCRRAAALHLSHSMSNDPAQQICPAELRMAYSIVWFLLSGS
jgi:hypothetical protein